MGGVLLTGVALLILLITVFAALISLLRAGIARSWLSFVRSIVLAISALLMVLAFPVSARRAKSQNSWSDVDGDGMLDGFVNGSYDWLDVNLSDFARTYVATTLLIAGAAILVLRLLPPKHQPTPEDRHPVTQ